MRSNNRGLPFSRCLASVILADFSTFVLMNLSGAPVRAAGVVWPVSLAAALVGTRGIRWRRVAGGRDRASWLLAGACLLMLTTPRIPYLLEWIEGNYVMAAFDDVARLAELASMTLSRHYPLRHPANGEYLLSFYYAALYPMAVIKLLVPVVTLKDSIFLGNLLYHVLLAGSFVEVSRLIFPDRRRARVLLFFLTLFGGLDWIPAAAHGGWRAYHAEWWQRAMFAANTQISSFFTGQFWVVHHFVGFWAVVLAWAVLFRSRLPNRRRKAAVVLALLAGAFYCSPFSVMSLPLLALANWRVVWRRLVRTWAAACIAPIALMPLFVFTGRLAPRAFVASSFRVEVTGLFWADKLLSMPVFLVLVPMVELGGVPLLLLLALRGLRPRPKAYLLASLAFFLATYFVAFAGSNNLSMRGMFLPSFVVFAVFAGRLEAIERRLSFLRIGRLKVLTAAVAVVLVAGGLAGSLREWVGMCRTSVKFSSLLSRVAGLRGNPDLAALKALRSRELARDPGVRVLKVRQADKSWPHLYDAEKLLDKKSLEEMLPWELELIRRPLGRAGDRGR